MYTGHYISHLVDSLQPQYRQLFVTILRCATSRVEDKELLSRNRRKSAKHRGSWASSARLADPPSSAHHSVFCGGRVGGSPVSASAKWRPPRSSAEV